MYQLISCCYMLNTYACILKHIIVFSNFLYKSFCHLLYLVNISFKIHMYSFYSFIFNHGYATIYLYISLPVDIFMLTFVLIYFKLRDFLFFWACIFSTSWIFKLKFLNVTAFESMNMTYMTSHIDLGFFFSSWMCGDFRRNKNINQKKLVLV